MVQYFISGLLGLMVFSTAATWGYHRFLNTHLIDFWTISSLEGKSSVTGTVSGCGAAMNLQASSVVTDDFVVHVSQSGALLARPHFRAGCYQDVRLASHSALRQHGLERRQTFHRSGDAPRPNLDGHTLCLWRALQRRHCLVRRRGRKSDPSSGSV